MALVQMQLTESTEGTRASAPVPRPVPRANLLFSKSVLFLSPNI